jgi:predicted metal-dependent hydrolase
MIRGVELFNRGEYFEAHEELEEAMNIAGESVQSEGDFEFYRGLLRAAVANHKLEQGAPSSAIAHLRAALTLLAPYPDRHHGLRLRELRQALTAQLGRLQAGSGNPELAGAAAPPPRIEMVPDAAK